MKISGYCPMGCGPTLVTETVGRRIDVRCGNAECEDPWRITKVMNEPEAAHVVEFSESGFTVQHPLRERDRAELFDCGLHAELNEALDGPPVPPGRYRVIRHQADPVSESYRGTGALPFDFEPID
jgi:hypothetical protein